ncbi:hypothetical protein PsYK624_024820 [Phanerochaete sordida]|uniref:Uncharacterized protein n=1 Tax=Phanerochaete sordida TaxID=48140 RepID=A0A9P3G1J0_9APHY|nr:hypothetical protein PsYK624_024820 [Phanerochaete sordida]
MLRTPLSRPIAPALAAARPRRSLALSPRLGRAAAPCTPHPQPSLRPAVHAPPTLLVRSHNQQEARRAHSTAPPSFEDPDRPGLFYHRFAPPGTPPVFALSFLAERPPRVDSASVLGWLPAAAPAGGDAGLNDFRENVRFLEIMHEAIRAALRDGVDEVQKNGAVQTQEGWMHIHDERNVPALGRIGDPDDIIASVRVEKGQILAETYQPMPAYRLCTSDGILKLTEGLARRLEESLRYQVQAELRP